jgi:outer membrane immunogenic protein
LASIPGGIELKKLLIAGIAAVAFCGAPALAADIPTKAPAYKAALPPAPTFNWTGFYVGVNAGGNWGTANTSTTVGESATGTFYGPVVRAAINGVITAPRSFDTAGFTGGIHGGYNWQLGNLLAGIELDVEYFRSTGSNTVSGAYAGPATATVSSSISTDWLFTARPRLGVLSNNWLFYGTGGLAVTRIKASWNFADSGQIGPASATSESASVSSTKAGWVIGGGIETALPGKILLGAEYLYVQFGNVSATSNAVSAGGIVFTNPITHTIDLRSNIVRARLSKQF